MSRLRSHPPQNPFPRDYAYHGPSDGGYHHRLHHARNETLPNILVSFGFKNDCKVSKFSLDFLFSKLV